MKLSISLTTSIVLSCLMTTSVSANDKLLPELLIGLQENEVQHLTLEEAADTRGESMRKEVSEYGHCDLRRCTRMFVNDQHIYTVYDDGSVYFVKH